MFDAVIARRALPAVLVCIATLGVADVGAGPTPADPPSAVPAGQEPARSGLNLTPADRKALREQGLRANMTAAEKAAAKLPKAKAAAARAAADKAAAEQAAAVKAAEEATAAARAAAAKAASEKAEAERAASERSRNIVVFTLGGTGGVALLAFLLYLGTRSVNRKTSLGALNADRPAVPAPAAAPEPASAPEAAPRRQAPAVHLGAQRRTPDVVVVDLETTGLSEEDGDRVVEIGLVRLGHDLRVKHEYTTLINPECDVGPTRIHGIRNADVQDAPTFADIAGDVGELFEGALLAAHYAPFDMRFLRAEFENVGLMDRMPTDVSFAVIDTVDLARVFLPKLRNHKLPTVCAACGIPDWDHHGALGDAKATAALLARLADMSGGALQSRLFQEALLLPPGWTGLKPSGRTRPRTTLASLAQPTGAAAIATSKPPPLTGEVAVFTGGLGVAKDEAVQVAEMLGCTVRTTVSGKTSIVVVGDPDAGRWTGVGSGATVKEREARVRAGNGQRVRFLNESDFMILAGIVSDGVITDEEWAAVREMVYGSVAGPGVPAARKGSRSGMTPAEQAAMRKRFSVRDAGGRWEVHDELLGKWRGFYDTRGEAYEARRELWAKFGKDG